MATARDMYEVTHHTERLVNDSGAALAQFEFTVLGVIPVVAMEAIAANAVGPVTIEKDSGWRIDEFVAGEDQFATPNQLVYWDPTSGNFSDTPQDGYYIVGQLLKVITAGALIEFLKFNVAELVTT